LKFRLQDTQFKSAEADESQRRTRCIAIIVLAVARAG